MPISAEAVATAEPVPESPFAPVRRFFIPDMDRHPWMVDRLCQKYAINGRQAIGWLRSLVESPEFCFLYQENSVALAEITRQHTLAVQPIITERFVW